MNDYVPWAGDPAAIVAAAEHDPLEVLRRIAALAPAWHADAACRTEPRDLFFPSPGQPVQPALEICATCTVRRECLDDALASPPPDIGIRGGASAKARRLMRQNHERQRR